MSYQVTQVSIPVSGGAVLAGDVMFPAFDGPYRVIVSMYPYHKDDVIGSVFDPPRRALASAGYASLLVDMRGTGASSGHPGACYDLGGVEGADGAAVVEWTAAQSWGTGMVGMWGVSYGAMMAIATAARRPPHLAAIVAAYGTNDCLHDAIAPGGSFFAIGRYSWVAHMLAMDLFPPTRQDEDGEWRRIWLERLERLAESPGHAFEWQPHLDDEPYWAARTADAERIEVPALLIGGWQDLYVDAIVRLFQSLAGPRRLLIGPWTHVAPDLADREPIDWVEEMRLWWDTHLDKAVPPEQQRVPPVTGEPTKASEAVIFVDGCGWRTFSTWPPYGGEVTFYPAPGHRLATELPATVARISFDPSRLTGQTAGLLDPLGTGLGRPQDQHDDDVVSLAFTTAPLQEPIEISGCASLQLELEGASDDLHLVAKLCDVSPDDSSSLLASGWRRVRGSGKGPAPVRLRCAPCAAVVGKGHRLRLSVSSADFPRFWPTAGDGSFSILTGGGAPARLTVPLRPAGEGETVQEMRRPPVPEQGWGVASTVVLRQSREEPNGTVETEVKLENELETPYGANVRIREHFRASASLAGPDVARVDGDVTMGIELADGSSVDIRVVSEFTERTARASASVALDGTSLLDEKWVSSSAAPVSSEI